MVFQTPSGISYGAISKLPCSLSLRFQWFLPLTQSCFRSEVLAILAACPCGSWLFGFVFLLSHPKHLGVKRWSRWLGLPTFFQNTSCPSSLSPELIRTCSPHHQRLMRSFPSQPLKTLAFGSVFLFASFSVILRTPSFMWLIHSLPAFPIPGSSHLQNLFLHSITGAPPPPFLESARTKVWYY